MENVLVDIIGRPEFSLKEYVSTDVKLSRGDVKILKTRFSEKIKIKLLSDEESAWKEGWYLINPRQYVGTISLPGAVIRSESKVDISNLIYMLGYIYGIDIFQKEIVYYEHSHDMFELIVRMFNRIVTELIKKRMIRGYKDVEENTKHPRGRILICQHVKENIARSRNYIFCVRDEYTADIIENQIIKYTLYVLSKYSYKNPLLYKEIMRNYHYLENVSHVVVRKFPIIRYTMRNRHYEPVHKLCRLLLDNLSISEKSGDNAFSSFLIDMNDTFEKFISKLLTEKSRNIKDIQILEQPRYYLDDGNKIGLEPDNVILKNYINSSILDTKYKKIGKDDFKNHDICTALKYCTGLGLKKAILLYPKWENVRKEVIKIINSDIEIAIMTIDLTGNRDVFNKNLDDLIKDIFEFTEIL